MVRTEARPRPAHANAMKSIRSAAYVLSEATKAFFRDNCPNLSAAVAFYTSISVIPILFLVFFVSGRLLGYSGEIHAAVLEFLEQLNPFIEEKIILEIQRLSETTRFMGWVGLGFLLWISTMFVSSLETAFTIIFKVKKKRHFLMSAVMSVAVIPLGFCAILFYVAINAGASFLDRWGIGLPIVHNTTIRYIIPLSVIVLFFTLLYKVIPNRKIAFSDAFVGGIVCTVLIEAAKYLFNLYLASGGNPAGFVYGSLKALVYLALWVFYIAWITLYAAEMVSVIARRKEKTR
jgi:membrane protein